MDTGERRGLGAMMRERRRLGQVARRSTVAALLAIGALSELALAGCGGRRVSGNATLAPTVPRFEDALRDTPDVLLIVRPQALRRDDLYGPLWQRLMRAALARGGAPTSSDRTLDAVDGSDAVVIALPQLRRRSDALLALRGVPSGFDAARLVDAAGEPVWQPPSIIGAVAEHAPVDARSKAALFVLPRREWVIALGQSVQDARIAFSRPRGHPPLDVDDAALALLRLDGASLVREVRPLRVGGLAPIGTRLVSVTLALAPGTERAIVAAFRYADEQAAKYAEDRVRIALSAITESSELGPRFGWLRGSVIARDATLVRIRSGLPPKLLQDLPGAAAEPLDL